MEPGIWLGSNPSPWDRILDDVTLLSVVLYFLHGMFLVKPACIIPSFHKSHSRVAWFLSVIFSATSLSTRNDVASFFQHCGVANGTKFWTAARFSLVSHTMSDSVFIQTKTGRSHVALGVRPRQKWCQHVPGFDPASVPQSFHIRHLVPLSEVEHMINR